MLTEGEVYLVLAHPAAHTRVGCPIVRRARVAGTLFIVDVDEAPGAELCTWCAGKGSDGAEVRLGVARLSAPPGASRTKSVPSS